MIQEDYKKKPGKLKKGALYFMIQSKENTQVLTWYVDGRILFEDI